jgi:hypothetical protein
MVKPSLALLDNPAKEGLMRISAKEGQQHHIAPATPQQPANAGWRFPEISPCAVARSAPRQRQNTAVPFASATSLSTRATPVEAIGATVTATPNTRRSKASAVYDVAIDTATWNSYLLFKEQKNRFVEALPRDTVDLRMNWKDLSPKGYSINNFDFYS